MKQRQFREQIIERCSQNDIDWLKAVQHDELFEEVIASSAFIRDFVWDIENLSGESISFLLSIGLDPNRHNSEPAPDGTYPLGACVRRNSIQNARILLQNGADPHLSTALNSLSNMRDASPDDQIAMCELLLEFGADINRELPNLPGFTPVCRAIEKGFPELVAYMVSRGAILPEGSDEDLPELDLDTFQIRLERAIAENWDRMRVDFPDETFCLFALETDADCVLVRAIFDSEESIKRDSSDPNRRKLRPEAKSFIGQVLLSPDSEFYSPTAPLLDELSAELNSVVISEESSWAASRRRKRLMKIFEQALKKCDQHGLFGTCEQRDRIVLALAIMDADQSEWKVINKIVRRLNPKTVVKQFLGR